MKYEDPVECFYETVWPHRAMVLRAARIQSGNIWEADDLAQETLLKAFRAINQFRPGTSIKAWLLTILRNTLVDRRRARASSAGNLSLNIAKLDLASPAELPSRYDSDLDSPQDLLDGFSDERVIDALQDLSEDARWVLLLVDVAELNQEEAATALGVPLGTVKSRLHRGRAALREALLPLVRDRRIVRNDDGEPSSREVNHEHE